VGDSGARRGVDTRTGNTALSFLLQEIDMPKLRFLPQGLALAASLALSFPTTAEPIAISVTGASFSVGAGYGNESNPTENGAGASLLKVAFDASALLPPLFTLDLAGPPGSSTHSFTFGTIVFQEPETNGGIRAAETDHLGVTADLVFSDPSIGTATLIGTGVATPGSVSDADIDYELTWSPVVVGFGDGGQLRISLDDLSWTGTGRAGSKDLTATVSLLSAPRQPVTNGVPEPSTVMLLGSAFAAFAWRRRFQQT
jgi:hypothetical protein